MNISVDVNNTIFNFKSNNYDIKLMHDYKNYGNGYIELYKVWPKDTKLKYQLAMLCEYPRPFRFHFSKTRTKVIMDGSDIDIIDFCNNIGDCHIVSFKAKCFKYRIKGDSNFRTTLRITELNVEED